MSTGNIHINYTSNNYTDNKTSKPRHEQHATTTHANPT